jgi:hypothetical protein
VPRALTHPQPPGNQEREDVIAYGPRAAEDRDIAVASRTHAAKNCGDTPAPESVDVVSGLRKRIASCCVVAACDPVESP